MGVVIMTCNLSYLSFILFTVCHVWLFFTLRSSSNHWPKISFPSLPGIDIRIYFFKFLNSLSSIIIQFVWKLKFVSFKSRRSFLLTSIIIKSYLFWKNSLFYGKSLSLALFAIPKFLLLTSLLFSLSILIQLLYTLFFVVYFSGLFLGLSFLFVTTPLYILHVLYTNFNGK